MMNLAYAWLVIVNFSGGVSAIPMPDMMFCQQEMHTLKMVGIEVRCIAGYDTRSKDIKVGSHKNGIDGK